VLGIDFAEQMLELAREKAVEAKVEEICRFENLNFFDLGTDEQFDYVLLMGFMDYISDAATVIKKALELTKRSSFFSFPMAGGILAWQRKIRYKKRCPLYLYSYEQLLELFQDHPDFLFKIRKIDRDFWVQVSRREIGE
ncbi:MAG: methyltransferase domain-containing protein, partial [Candidatus Cloacimonadaceae bacterium]|nr:methyltransferase domain-containing protein [Candidatus Cloacimonadaceae bacterium]